MSSPPRPVTLRLDYVFHYASVMLFLTWTFLVIKSRIFELADPDATQGEVHIIPLVSDASRHPTQHPFAAASFALALYQVWFANLILLVVSFGRDTDKKVAAWTSFVLVTFAAGSLGVSICLFADSRVHYAFATLGCSCAIIWMAWLSFCPPFPEKSFVVRGCWICTVIAILAVIFGTTGFFIQVRSMTALGEYIIFTAVSVLLSLIGVGGRGTHVVLNIKTVSQNKLHSDEETVEDNGEDTSPSDLDVDSPA